MTNKKYYVLLDSNILAFHSDLLQDPIGQAFLYTLRVTGGAVVMPSVVLEEVKKHTLRRFRDALKGMQDSASVLGRLGGFGGYFDAPKSEEEMSVLIARRITSFEDILIHTDYDLEQAQRALKRVINDEPPNGPKNQQYKDSLIWEIGIRFLEQGPLYFVTNDSGFYESRQVKDGLANNLRLDLEGLPNSFYIFNTLDKCLSELTTARTDLKDRIFVTLLDSGVRELIKDSCNDQRVFITDMQVADSRIKVFDTGNEDEMALKFHLIYSATIIKYDDGISISGKLNVFGAAFCHRKPESVGKIHIHHVYFTSPQIEDGKVWLRISGELGEEGPVPVSEPYLWVRSNTNDREVWVGNHADTISSLLF